MRIERFSAVFCLLPVTLAALAACAGVPHPTGGRAGSERPREHEKVFAPGQLAKTDIDRVADAYRQEVFAGLQTLAGKLYRRNPREWRKSGAVDLDAALARLGDPANDWRFADFGGRYGSEAIQLAFRDDYRGDRVLALIGGLGGMLHNAFNDKTEFFMTDDLDPQKLHNSARNVEIAMWRLANARDANDTPFLLSNETDGAAQLRNLSFEREFGKLVGHLDLLSRIVADKESRTIVKMFQNLAGAVFLPVAALR